MKFQAFDPAQFDFGGDSRALGDAILLGMAPFQVRDVVIYMDYEIDYNRYRVVGEVVLFNLERIAYTVKPDRDDLINYPLKTKKAMCDEFTQVFRNRVGLPAPDNIILGEY